MIRRTAFVLALALATCPLGATTYTLEPRHTVCTVRWSHLDFAYPTAQFSQVEGTLVFDPAEPRKASVTVTIPLATLSSGIPDLDDDFRSPAFVDLARFPTATFKLTKPIELGSVPADRQEVTASATGDLTLRGTTRPVTFNLTARRNAGSSSNS